MQSIYCLGGIPLFGGFTRCFLKWRYLQIIHFKWIFHEINHPYLGTTILGNTHLYSLYNLSIALFFSANLSPLSARQKTSGLLAIHNQCTFPVAKY